LGAKQVLQRLNCFLSSEFFIRVRLLIDDLMVFVILQISCSATSLFLFYSRCLARTSNDHDDHARFLLAFNIAFIRASSTWLRLDISPLRALLQAETRKMKFRAKHPFKDVNREHKRRRNGRRYCSEIGSLAILYGIPDSFRASIASIHGGRSRNVSDYSSKPRCGYHNLERNKSRQKTHVGRAENAISRL
jgi:hypothetical protein